MSRAASSNRRKRRVIPRDIASIVAVALLLPAAGASIVAAQDNPFATSEDRAKTASDASPAESENPFLTTEEAARRRLIVDEEPFDVIVLKERPPREMEVLPLDFPGRDPPAVKPKGGVLKVRPRAAQGEEYLVSWDDVVEVRLFEERALAEATSSAAAGRFDEAFEIVSFLRKRHPQTRGLADAEQRIVALEARHELERGRLDDALSLALRLQTLNSGHPQLPEMLAPTADKLFAERLKTGRLAAARIVLEQLTAALPQHPTTKKLQADLAAAVAERIENARVESSGGRESAAQMLLKEALALAPRSVDAAALYRKSLAASPTVVVGVVEPYSESTTASPVLAAADWPRLRAERLVRRPALDLVTVDARAGRVEYKPGRLQWTADEADFAHGKLRIVDGVEGIVAADVAAVLLRAAVPTEPTFSLQWAAHRATLTIDDPRTLEIRFGLPHPRPEALLGRTLAAAQARSRSHAGRIGGREPTSDGENVRFNRNSTSPGPDVIERTFADEQEAVDALLAGKIDVVDRVAPWQVAALESDRDVRLVRYAPLSVHCLFFQPRQDILKSAEFRRALGYALDRETILKVRLKAGDEAQGTRIARGVFSAGRSPDDPLGYAGQGSPSQRGYEPRAAFILSRLAAAGSNGNAPKTITLVIAHPPTATARLACEQIGEYWQRIGIDVRLRRYDEGDLAEADVVYRALVIPEPLVEAEELFGADGPTAALGSVSAAVGQLAAAESFEEARAALFELQRSAHDQALMLPLWQINEYAACRSELSLGDGSAPFWLYQNVDRWKFTAASEERRP